MLLLPEAMFDFIKNDRGEEIKGFQWFIDNYGPLDANPLLTVDMLWDFFYEKGRASLSTDIRTILDCYARTETKQLSSDEKRVLKAVLLLQAISQKVGGSVEFFVPNDKNINNAFEGTDMIAYLDQFKDGELPRLANEIKDTMPADTKMRIKNAQ